MNRSTIIIAFAMVLGLLLLWHYSRYPLTTTVNIKGHVFTVEVAATEQEKEKGLGYRDSLAKNTGMLFPYDHEEQYHYWMKGMRFPIDIIWIKDKTIIDISKNVPVAFDSYLTEYFPKLPVNKVLEVNAGSIDNLNIKIGDTVTIRN